MNPKSMNEMPRASCCFGVQYMRDWLKAQMPQLWSRPVCHLLGPGRMQIRGFSKGLEDLTLELRGFLTLSFRTESTSLKTF